MAARRTRVRLELDDANFIAGMARAAAAAHTLSVSFATAEATWEPIDWSDFD